MRHPINVSTEELLRLRQEGMSHKEIAAKFNCSETLIFTRAKRMGLNAKDYAPPKRPMVVGKFAHEHGVIAAAEKFKTSKGTAYENLARYRRQISNRDQETKSPLPEVQKDK